MQSVKIITQTLTFLRETHTETFANSPNHRDHSGVEFLRKVQPSVTKKLLTEPLRPLSFYK